MKDLPMFTTEYGIASLILREVPYQQTAYIRLQSSDEPQKLLDECVKFCRMVGAEKILVKETEDIDYPFYTAIWRMTCPKDSLADTDAALWPVQEETVDAFKKIYNEKVSHVPNAAWMDAADEKQMLKDGEGYFVHRGKTLLGIGRVLGGEIRFLASVQPSAGVDVVKALAHAATEDTITIEVASANEKAVKLYENLGFIKIAELSRWLRVR
jgi:GNAT superfamily N-acetyltransferase